MKLWICIIVLFGSMAFGDEPTKVDAVKPINGMENLDDTIALRKSDRISVRIVEDRDKTQSLLVQEDGQVNFPHIGLMKAEGLTSKALASAAKVELEKQFFKNATVIVAVEFGCPKNVLPQAVGPHFTISGQVQRQGRYGIDKDEKLTVAQAILRAGGPSFGTPKVVKVIRRTAEGKKTIEVNIKDIMENGDLSKDILILDEDVIIIPE